MIKDPKIQRPKKIEIYPTSFITRREFLSKYAPNAELRERYAAVISGKTEYIYEDEKGKFTIVEYSQVQDSGVIFKNHISTHIKEVLKRKGYDSDKLTDSFFKEARKVLRKAEKEGINLYDEFLKPESVKLKKVEAFEGITFNRRYPKFLRWNEAHVDYEFQDDAGPLNVIVYPLEQKAVLFREIYSSEGK